MLTKRIVPCLDVKDGRVVKGTNFTQLNDVNDPVELAIFYNESGADELVFYDITASNENRGIMLDIVEKTASKVHIPLTVGGGISTVEDFRRVLRAGADKISVNSSAVKNPRLISDAAEIFGAQCVVASMDVKRTAIGFEVFINGGRTPTGILAEKWAVECEKLGAGELCINSIDTDGVKNGFDCELLSAIEALTTIPIIASGGAGKAEHFLEVFTKTTVNAALAASVFHFGEIDISKLKKYLSLENINMRLE